MLRPRSREERETGQMLVLFALVLVVIFAFAALAVDLGVLRNNRQILRNTTDAAALAGGSLMPVKGSVPGAATAVAKLVNSTIQTNYPGLPQSATALGSRCVVGVDAAIAQCAYTISYRCLIGADSSGPLICDIPAACDPRPSLGASNIASHFTGAGDTRISTFAILPVATCATSSLSSAAPPRSTPSPSCSGSRPETRVPSPRPRAAGRAGRHPRGSTTSSS